MRIGVPKEIKPLEGRVALIPAACAEFVHKGQEILIETGAGLQSGYGDEDYRAAGAVICPDAKALYEQAELVVKVKEPVEGDLQHLREHHVLFCYLHLAANPALGQRLREIGLTAVAFETVTEGGALPLLAPMSEIAGRLSIQVCTHLLHQPQGGPGILLGGVPAAERGRVVVLGGGVAGRGAAALAAAIGAEVTVFDKRPDRLAAAEALGANVTGLQAYRPAIAEAVAGADIVIGAVLLPGRRAPHLVTRDMVQAMRAGSAIADISVDQGGCMETTHPTTYEAPVYVEEGVSHFCVTNMPGAVPRTASQALCAAISPYVLRLTEIGWEDQEDLLAGINVRDGEYVNPDVRAELN